jgi:hypothetical protein
MGLRILGSISRSLHAMWTEVYYNRGVTRAEFFG